MKLKPPECTYYYRKASFAFLCIFMLAYLNSSELTAQPTLQAKNMGVAGIGTAYLSGFSSLYYNPANLMIREYPLDNEIVIGQGAVRFEPVISSEQASAQWKRNRWFFKPYEENGYPSDRDIDTYNRTKFLNENYRRNRTVAENDAYAEIVHLGYLHRNSDNAWAVGMRTRYANRFNIGRGWYSHDLVNGDSTLNQSLRQDYQVLHEISFGWAQSFTYINGLNPNLRRLFIGIAPKFVMGGDYLRYDAGRTYHPETNKLAQKHQLYSAGATTKSYNAYRRTGMAGEAAAKHLSFNAMNQPSGYGVGLDFGLAYVFTFSDDLSILGQSVTDQGTYKSVRFGFSITDIGMIRYKGNTLQASSVQDTTTITPAELSESQSIYMGSPGEFMALMNLQNSQNAALNAQITSGPFTTLLPTAFHAGALFEYNRLSLMADITMGLTKNAYYSGKGVYRLGMELKPLPFLPVRGGIRFHRRYPVQIGMGTGVELHNWSLNVAGMFTTKNNDVFYEGSGAAISTLKFHF